MEQENCLRVRMLGGFSIEYANRPISFGKRTQSRFIQLFQLLMLHQEGVGKDQLIEALYGWEDIGNKNICLNNLVYRLRKQLASAGLPGDEYVKVGSGLCVWNGAILVDSDVQEFEEEYDAGLRAADQDQQVGHLMRAWNIYTGELLPQLASENWVIEESERLKKLYSGCVNRLGQLLKSRREYQQMLEVYRTAADLYPFEEYRGGVLDSLVLLERYEEAHQYYNDTIRLYTEELEAPPSKELMDRFCAMREKLVQRDNSFPQIRENLMEGRREKGAYFCAYPGFVDVYHAICRGTERNGQTAILMICNLQQIQTAREKRNSQNVSEWLRESIRTSLRRGDMCTRYSRSKYLILLTGVREADCGIIMKRIKSRFESSRSTEGYRLEFSVAKAEESLELPPES